MNNRRNFLRKSAILAGSGIIASAFDQQAFASTRKWIPPSDRINLGAIGINGMGWANVEAAVKVPGVNLVALCDVDKNVLDRRIGDLTKLNINPSGVKTYPDYRKLLDRKDIDVVIIGTPEHWHALIMMNACEAGKDVYVEKPVGNSIGECMAMVAAKNGSVL
jgi:predicted dehydrogenase